MLNVVIIEYIMVTWLRYAQVKNWDWNNAKECTERDGKIAILCKTYLDYYYAIKKVLTRNSIAE